MLVSLLLAVLPAAPPLAVAAPEPSTSATAIASEDDPKAEYKTRRKAAGDDVDKLMELYDWCDAHGLKAQGKSCLRRVVKLDSAHRKAHELLGHIEYKGQWFDNERKLEKFRQETEAKEMEAKGLALFRGEWVPKEDIQYLLRGLVKNDDGEWVNKEEQERLAAGWVRQDMVWVSPDEISKMEEGLWKCGENWVSLEEANKYHAELDTMWAIPSRHFLVYTTCDREVAKAAMGHIDDTYDDLARILGVRPTEKIPIVVLRNPTQYGSFAAGVEGERRPAESHGLSSVHYSFLADVWFAHETHIPAGVGYWWAEDPSGYGENWGKHSVRHAAGQSFVEAVDGSPNARIALAESGSGDGFVESFWEEKKLPDWFRFGAATYVERYFIDQHVGNGGNARWAWEWSVQNLVRGGGFHPMDQFFEFPVSVDNLEESARLMNESGLIMSFIVDGGVQSVSDAHDAVTAAIREGDEKAIAKAVAKLEKELKKREKDLRNFGKV